jgi:hypothetical protein
LLLCQHFLGDPRTTRAVSLLYDLGASPVLLAVDAR